jgi:hypothetical protein
MSVALIAAGGNATMHKQRLFMLIAAGIGALACFLPWVNAPILGAVAGTQGSDGYVCLGLFVGAGALALLGDRTKPLSLRLGVGSSLSAAGAMAIGVAKVVNVQSITDQMDKSNPLVAALATTVSVGIGLFLVVATGAAVPVLFGFMHQPPVPPKASTTREGAASSQKARKKQRRDNQLEELPEEVSEEVDALPSATNTVATKRKRLEALMVLGLFLIIGVSWFITRDPAPALHATPARGGEAEVSVPPRQRSSPPTPRIPTGGDAVTFGRPTVKGMSGGMTMVMVEVTNNRDKSITCTLTATFKKGDTILAAANGTVNNLSPGGTKTAQLMSMDDIAGYDTVKIEPGACF